MGGEIRVSQRLKKIRKEKRAYYGCDRRRNRHTQDTGVVVVATLPKKPKLITRTRDSGNDVKSAFDAKSAEDDLKWLVPSASVFDENGMKVKETLRLFNLHFLEFVQEEEKRSETTKAENDRARNVDVKRPSKRPDLKAISKARC
ncbi:hypothetical protein PanWU01x14_193060 [Parasponia andersonii]|uniref:Uncharacterized protein n=1 Tax=Parasponia andersonii TaxID=3476 RepID=A0A2P5C172_PARAD|nr:hypothetical protein PanWU01x14_193060 [Parasponia andersonii]